MVYQVYINNGASIQVKLGLSIIEIYVDRHSKSYKDPYFKVSMSLCSCYLTIDSMVEYI